MYLQQICDCCAWLCNSFQKSHMIWQGVRSLQQFKSEFCPTPEAATVHKDVVSVINKKKRKRKTYISRHGFKSKSKIIQLCMKTELYLHKNKRHNKRPWGKEATVVFCPKYYKFRVFNPWIQVQSYSHSSISTAKANQLFWGIYSKSFTRKKVLPNNNNDLRKSECRTWTAAL